MGNEYSRIKGHAFPTSSFLVGFRQPDVLQVIHAPAELGKLIRLTVINCWLLGIRSERKFSLGFELRLEKEPFDSEVQPIDRLVSIYKMVNQLLKVIIDAGCSLVTSGIFIQGACRSSWVLRAPPHEQQQAAGLAGVDLLTVAFEDWGRLLTINAPQSVNSELLTSLAAAWPKGAEVAANEPTSFAVELREQPWDSYKADGDRGPLIVLELVRILGQHGYRFLAATHARGNMDCLTFARSRRHGSDELDGESGESGEEELMVLSLNQRDQIRLYNAPDEVARRAAAFCRENWAAGFLREETSAAARRLVLKSSPWFVPDWDRTIGIGARELLQELLKEICSMGWKILLNADIYRSAYDKSLLVLRRSSQAMVQPHMIVAIQESSHLLILGAPEELKDKLMSEVRDSWFRSQQCEAMESVSGWTIDFTFNDKPWQWDPENPDVTVEGLGLVAALLDLLGSMGWRLAANMDVTGSCKFAPTSWIMQLQLEESRRLKIG